MKVLVTGANGFLGSHIIRILVEEGYEVRAFILEGTSQDNIAGLPYEVFIGNLKKTEDIERALESCDYLIHAAAITDVWPTKNPFSWAINYEVVKNLAEAVKRSSIKKYIHVGTANSFGYGSLNTPGDETSQFNCGKYGLDYINSKKAAQDYLLKEAKDGLPVVIINPTFMIGENDSKPSTGEMIISVIQGKVPGYSAGGRCFASVKDVAHGCVNAIQKGRIGECYIAGGTNLCYKDFFDIIGVIAGVAPPKRKVPVFLAVALGGILTLSAHIGKRKPKISVAMAKISGDGHYYSSQKAIRELALPQTDIHQALSEAITWYQTHGFLK